MFYREYAAYKNAVIAFIWWAQKCRHFWPLIKLWLYYFWFIMIMWSALLSGIQYSSVFWLRVQNNAICTFSVCVNTVHLLKCTKQVRSVWYNVSHNAVYSTWPSISCVPNEAEVITAYFNITSSGSRHISHYIYRYSLQITGRNMLNYKYKIITI